MIYSQTGFFYEKILKRIMHYSVTNIADLIRSLLMCENSYIIK